MSTKFATLYNNLPAQWHDLFVTYNTEESLTQQSDLESTDINVIMRRHAQTGMAPVMQMEALTGDFSDITDFHDAQQRILEAREAFMEIPAQIRDRFDNDPKRFAEFATDPANLPELRKLGLANPATIEENAKTAIPPQEIEEYDDHGTRTRTNDAPRYGRDDAARGPDSGDREGGTAVRKPEGLRPNGDRKTR